MQHLGDKLHALRRRQGLSQEKLAEALGVSRQAVSKWELGDAVPDVENLLKLSEIFGVSTDYLLRDDMPENARPAAGPEPEPPGQDRRRILRIAGMISAALGLLGQLVIWVLSTMIRLPVPGVVREADGMVKYVWDGRRGYSYKYFIQEYRLQAIRTILLVLIIAGLVLLLWHRLAPRVRAWLGSMRRARDMKD